MDTRNLTRGALFIAIGIILPFAFHAIGGAGIGRMLLPMHIPILISGFFCGPVIAMLVGITTPLLSALFTGMPPLMPPVAQMMVFELGTYGLLIGLLYTRTRLGVYPVLIVSMIAGRLVYGLLGYAVLPLFGLTRIPLLYPVTYGLLTGLPGIAVQLVVIPLTVYLIHKNLRVLVSRPA